MSESLVEWYRKNRISPVRQNISNLGEHFQRREALYRHLGLPAQVFRGSRIIEVGPGSGFNSLWTAAQRPAEYVLLEGNPTGVEHIRELFQEHNLWDDAVMRIEGVLLEEYKTAEPFDIVLCEGVLGGVHNPKEFLKLLLPLVAPSGVLVITCIDHVSYFPDTLRRMCAQLMVSPDQSLEEQTEILLPAFSPHLDTLPGMSRRYDDWVIDNLINPASIGPLLSIADAIEVAQENFDAYYSSPHFGEDWRWYKHVVGAGWDFNRRMTDNYWANLHNFLDYSRVYPRREEKLNRELHTCCVRTRDHLRDFERSRNRESVVNFQRGVSEIAKQAQAFSPELAGCFNEVAALIDIAVAGKPGTAAAVGASKSFARLFGRGQPYMSFIRRAA